MKISVVEGGTLSRGYDKRYIVIDEETGDILDDAQGYGYKSTQKAWAAWNYKHRDKNKDKAKTEKTRKIKKWRQEHKSFVKMMSQFPLRLPRALEARMTSLTQNLSKKC